MEVRKKKGHLQHSMTQELEKQTKKLHELPSRVVYVHPKGRFYIREYMTAGGPIHETFMGLPE